MLRAREQREDGGLRRKVYGLGREYQKGYYIAVKTQRSSLS